jgi:hypothetical protein
MAHPQVVVGGNGLQLWRVAENTLNKQPLTDKGWSSSLWFCVGLRTAQLKKKDMLRTVYTSLELGWILWINILSNGIWI